MSKYTHAYGPLAFQDAKETLGLLRWLASSEAADDINSDDELVRETILSPLLPATTIEKVLEKANMDFESESQKECQDILDSIDNLINFEDLKEESYPSNQNHSPNPSSEKMIPQVDGAGDDFPLTPCAGTTGNSSETKVETKFGRTSGHQLPKDAGTSFNHKRKRKKVLWGSLPFSDREAVSFCGDSKDVVGISSFSEKGVGKDEDASMKDANSDVCGMKDTTTLIGCSVRDLMRRKRFYKVEPVECGSQGNTIDILESEQKEVVNIFPRRLDFQRSHVDELDGRTNKSFDNSLSLTDQQFDVKTTDFGCAPCGKFECLSSSGNSLDASALGDGKLNSYISNNDDGIREITQSWLSKPNNLDSASSIGNFETYSGKESHVPILKSAVESNLLLKEQLQQTDASTSSCLQSALKFEVSCKDRDGKSSLEGQPSRGWIHEMSVEKPAGTDATPEIINFNDGQSQGGEASMVFKSNPEDKNLITLTFCKEPPIADWSDRTSGISTGHTSSGV